jgi:hypothetical protein
MEENPLKSEQRRLRREERFGQGACCVLCGEPELKGLIPVKRKLLDKHDVAGRAHDPSVWVIVCRNCHAKLTAGALDAGADMRPQPTLLHRLVMMLRALGSFFEMVGQAICRWADEILRLVTGLDKDCPNWRDSSEAK